MAVSFFAPRFLRHANRLAKSAEELLHRKRDLLSGEEIATYETAIARFRAAVETRDRMKILKAGEALDGEFEPIAHAPNSLREWAETIVVSIAVVVAFRAYFLQPFEIPTGSMQPTLNGLIAVSLDPKTPLPNVVQRTFERALFGHAYVTYQIPRADTVAGLRESPLRLIRGVEIPRTVIQWTSGESTTLWVPLRQLSDTRDGFGVYPGKSFKAGDSVVHGYVQSGDRVFVDRMSYQFRHPDRGEVFVFKTEGIPGIGGGQSDMSRPTPGEHYIKRLAAVPGDTLRIEAPRLFINGAPAQEFGLDRVAKAVRPYKGYTNSNGANLLRTPNDTYTCGTKDYFALGDNSGNSSDSRFWGPVPEPNLLGRGYFVYWPFGSHWGWIK